MNGEGEFSILRIYLKNTCKTMLEFSKRILKSVSFDRRLFRKELQKAINWSDKEERIALKAWCLLTFGHVYADVIKESFSQVLVS